MATEKLFSGQVILKQEYYTLSLNINIKSQVYAPADTSNSLLYV